MGYEPLTKWDDPPSSNRKRTVFFVPVTVFTFLIPWDSSPLQTQHLVGICFVIIFSKHPTSKSKRRIHLFGWF